MNFTKILITSFLFFVSTILCQAQPPEFSFNANTSFEVFLGNALINGVAASGDDWIAAFDSQGLCVGAKQLQVSAGIAYCALEIYGDNLAPFSPEKDGMVIGENFTLRLWIENDNAFVNYPDNDNPIEFSGWIGGQGFAMPDYNDPSESYNFLYTPATGCTDPTACNNGGQEPCTYATDWFADTDEDGLGDPNNIMNDCNQPTGYVANSDDDCDGVFDCLGTCNGDSIEDACGICGGDGTTCVDNDGDGNPASTDPDDNDPCNPDNTVGACDSDSDGVADGDDCAPNDSAASIEDACGICGGDGSTCTDNDGDGNPASTDPDDNDPCNPDNTVGVCDSDNDGVADGDDCAPNDATASVEDACGVCGGDGSTCVDNDGDGNPASTDPDDNDPCNPDNTVGACDSDSDGVADGNDCAPNDATVSMEDECGVCGGSGQTTWYADTDGDGLGDPNNTTMACTQPDGFVDNSTDTDDTIACTGTIDVCGVCDGSGESTWYADTDGDGLGDANNSINACTQPDGFIDNSDDTDDTIACTGTIDICGVCDGSGELTWYADTDGDGLGDVNNSVSACTQPDGFVDNANDDCDGAFDCLGACNGTTTPGTSCDDNNACTVNDVYDADCNCVGTFADEDTDGICDNDDTCPGFDNNLIGTTCDDNDANTENDVYTEDCNCLGTPIFSCSGALDTLSLDRTGALSVVTDFPIDGDERYLWYNENDELVTMLINRPYYSPLEVGTYYVVVLDPDFPDCFQVAGPRTITSLEGCCELED